MTAPDLRALVEAYELALDVAQYVGGDELRDKAEKAKAALLAYGTPVPNPTDTARALVDELENATKRLTFAERAQSHFPVLRAMILRDEARTALLAYVAGVDTSEHRCKTCRYATTDDYGMECNLTDRPFGDAANGTAIAVPGEGCGAILQVSPDFGCVRWEARKDGV